MPHIEKQPPWSRSCSDQECQWIAISSVGLVCVWSAQSEGSPRWSLHDVRLTLLENWVGTFWRQLLQLCLDFLANLLHGILLHCHIFHTLGCDTLLASSGNCLHNGVSLWSNIIPSSAFGASHLNLKGNNGSCYTSCMHMGKINSTHLYRQLFTYSGYIFV